MKITTIPALKTNYFWLVQPNGQSSAAYIFDPGDEPPVTLALQHQGLNLAGIIVTHHHWDHTDGIAALLERFDVPVYGPHSDNIANITHRLAHGERLQLPDFELDVIATPGHTLDHIAYLYTDPTGLNHLFSADNIFGAGCGRRFEGSPEMYYQSLQTLAKLPPDTLIYSSHEYTLDNIRFALKVEPDNQALLQRQQAAQALRARGEPTVPTTLALELATNPFLRCHTKSVRRAANARGKCKTSDEVAVFDVIRRWKDAG